jgi:ABC-type glycerol-3-phosphate transport system permease component
VAVKVGTIIKYILVLAVVFLLLLPFLLMVASSFKPYKEILNSNVTFLPREPTIRGYRDILVTKGEYDDLASALGNVGEKIAIAFHIQSPGRSAGIRDFPQYFINTIVTAFGTAILSVAVATLAAYGLARYRFPGRNLLSRSVLFMYVFPTTLLLVPVYKMFAGIKVGDLSLLDNHYGLMIIYAAFATPFLTWLLQAFIESIPREIEEAAEVDGAGGFSRFMRITLPLAAPGIITAGIYGFVYGWGEFTFASILISTNDLKVGSVALGSLATSTASGIEFEPLFAGTMIVAFPVLIFFFPVAKYFVQGFMAGAVRE